MINSRDFDKLRPRTREKAVAFQTACREAGVPVLIYQTLRDKEYQDSLYAQGRTMPGKIVTNAKGGQSYHEYGVAFDFVPLVGGLPAWKDTEQYMKCIAIGEKLGLESGKNFKDSKGRPLVDLPHMQDTMGYSIADYAAGKAPP